MGKSTDIEDLRTLVADMNENFSKLVKEMKSEMNKNFSDLVKEMKSDRKNVKKQLKKLSSKINKLNRDVDGIYQGNNNAMPPESLAAMMSLAASVQIGADVSGFSTGKAKKMQILSDLNISR